MSLPYTFKTSREFTATPAEIYAAIKDPTRLARWWGPSGFTNKFETFEFKTGGRWIFSMIGPDGKVYPNNSSFGALEPDRLVVVRHESIPKFVLTITLESTPGGTRVVWEQVLEDAVFAQSVRHIIEPANEQNLDRLAAELSAKR